MYKNEKILFKVQKKKKKLKTKIQEFQIQVTAEQCAICKICKCAIFYQNVQYATLSKGLLSNLGVRTPLRKVPKLGHILFTSAC